MVRLRAQKGFTLVELAVSLTIIGILIGGVLKGRQLMENARVAAAVAQVASVKAATDTFLRTYNGLPGDLKNAGARIPKCPNCNPVVTSGGAGNGAVGEVNWNLADAQGATGVNAPPTAIQSETLLFWAMLNQSGLFSGVSYDGSDVSGAAVEFGIHAPAARIGGGWIVGQADGTPARRQPLAINYADTDLVPNGLFLVLAPSPKDPLNAAAGLQILTPLSAAAIDEKIDDGKALTGSVVGYGFNSSSATSGCFQTARTRPEPAQPYNEAVQSKDCGVFVQINN